MATEPKNGGIKKLEGVKYIAISDVVVGARLREDSSIVRQKIESIAQSIKQHGPLQPIVLDEDKNLIDGGCRIQAYTLLGCTEVPYVKRSKVSAKNKIILEVEANLQRSDLTWQDKVKAIGTVHDIKEEEADNSGDVWGQRATGSLLGVDAASVNNALKVWPAIKKGDEEIKNCESLTEALMVLVERKKNDAIAFSLAVAKPSPTQVAPSQNPYLAPGSKPVVFSLGKAEHVRLVPTVDVSIPAQHIDLSRLLHNVDCVSWMLSQPRDSVHAIVTDIPYGVDLANMEGINNIDMMKSTHDVSDNLELMPKFLEAAYQILRPNSYCLFFYALQHHEKLRNWGEASGFAVQDWPLLWLKPHSCKNNAPQCNWTKSFEPMMVMRKGSPVLHTKMTKCHLEVDGMPDKQLQSNPFAKPHIWLSEMVFKPLNLQKDSIILDPFAGEGSILSSAILHGLTPIGLEIDTNRFPALVSRIQRIYKGILHSAVEFTLPEMKQPPA